MAHEERAEAGRVARRRRPRVLVARAAIGLLVVGAAAATVVAASTAPAPHRGPALVGVGPSGRSPSLGFEAPPKGTVTWFQGLGTYEPSVVSFGGVSPWSDLEHVHWTTWGGRRATGEAWTYYGDPYGFVHVRVVAFDLGACDGHLAYLAITSFAPQLGETFMTNGLTPICNGPGLDWYHPAGSD